MSTSKWDSLNNDGDYYIINFSSGNTKDEAQKVTEATLPISEGAGYLWIPDFASLSGKEIYSVFLDQSKDMFSIMESLQLHKAQFPGIYAVRVNHSKERWVAYSPIDIRINGEKQKMILTHARPEEEEAYYNDGGEDWMWNHILIRITPKLFLNLYTTAI